MEAIYSAKPRSTPSGDWEVKPKQQNDRKLGGSYHFRLWGDNPGIAGNLFGSRIHGYVPLSLYELAAKRRGPLMGLDRSSTTRLDGILQF
ncbi:hypothetical protein RRG08_059668 [Elysia crispata]|uniref:Uncharacterized protein n=1 Tax=Elysia crispata TaxID=231223 RepID=A0AAE1EA93_9GAST|nr:hypothetical protein RRG08_059668 [Elysia crispata]